MWAKVGREKLYQGGGSFWVSDERRDFEVGAIEMRAVWRAELRGGAWDLSFCGEKGGCLSRSLWGEGWFFWAGGGDEGWEGGFVVWERGGGVELGVQGGGAMGTG
jgi:hypothetical protein